MEHSASSDEVKDAARIVRRQADLAEARSQTGEIEDERYTGYWLVRTAIWGPKSNGEYYVDHNRIYGPDGDTGYALRKGHFYGPGQEGEFHIRGDRIYGPSHRLPFLPQP